MGEELKKLRHEKKMTQEKLGRKIGRSKHFIYRLEKRHAVINRKLVDKIIEALNLDVYERLRLEISFGILSGEIKNFLLNKGVLELFANLSESKLPEIEKQMMEDDIIAVLGFFARRLKRHELLSGDLGGFKIYE